MVQHIMNCISYGYRYFDVSYVPLHKMEKAHFIDDKLIKKYNANLSKDRKYYYKKKGIANHIYLRWQSVIVILRTDGEVAAGNDSGFTPFDKETGVLPLKIGNKTEVEIHAHNNQLSLVLSNSTYRRVRAEILEYIEHGNINAAIYTFNALNGIPAYYGINKQQVQMYKEILRAFKKSNLFIDKKLLFIRRYRKIYKVFDKY